jgi:ribonuclease BN (tRNA processing enzyme)
MGEGRRRSQHAPPLKARVLAAIRNRHNQLSFDWGSAMSALQAPHETTRSNGSARVVMLGTGTPRPDPDRAGPATAVVVNDTPYLIDFGTGVIRRATAAYQKGVMALGYGGVNIKTVFLTHMHSDHTVGYPDLIFTPWVVGRYEPLSVYGPKGIKAMTEHVLKAWQVDTETRVNGVDPKNSTGCTVNVTEIVPGVIFQDCNVMVTAFSAHHATVDSFSFRFDTPGRAIVISGDTSPTRELLDHGRGCDVLVHEVYSMHDFRRDSPQFQECAAGIIRRRSNSPQSPTR